ncbi:MAG: iron ABC transporter permease [Verrucomicrobia bacterium]|nr:iron ABC transporter permease [Verrucomicrobiota bacterium]
MRNGRYDLDPVTVGLSLLLFAFFGVFLVYPSCYMVREAFQVDGRFSWLPFQLLAQSPLQQESLLNSLVIAVSVTLGATVVAAPMAWLLTRFDFRGKAFLNALLLAPMVLPPFVGAIGLKQLLAQFGSLNLLLMELGWIAESQPVDWLGSGGMAGITVLLVFSFYPILLLNLNASMANIDPALLEAAHSLGAGHWRVFRSVIVPLVMPSYFAGAAVVFIAAFTDLGAPLIFGFSRVVPVQIFEAVTDMNANPSGSAWVVLVLAMSTCIFWVSRRWLGARRFEMVPKASAAAERQASPRQTLWIWLMLGGWSFLCLAPHVTVAVQSIADRWFFTVLPESTTLDHFKELAAHGLTSQSIKNSLFYSLCSAVIDLLLGVAIAWLLTRRRAIGAGLLDALAMIPIALPGLVLAFGYAAAFDFNIPWLNPRSDPTLLLILSYSVRRLPYVVRSACAGFQQSSITLEEASASVGAPPGRTLWRITLPLVRAHLIAGTLLAFSFAMLEVSDGLVLAMRDAFFPMTKMIYALMGRVDPQSGSIACALGVLGMLILGASLLLASRLLGKSLGQIFR